MRDRLPELIGAGGPAQVPCYGFQVELSAMFDHELPEHSARRAVAHMEACPDCESFFGSIRMQAQAHRDISTPDGIANTMRRLQGLDSLNGVTDREVVRRLAVVLYELGKAYTLLASSEEYRIKVVEEPVQIDRFRRDEATEAVAAARSIQADAAERAAKAIEERSGDYLKKASQLLFESIDLKPRFTEARLYLGFIHQLSGDPEAAKRVYNDIFLNGSRDNRVHAATQLGMLHDEAEEHREALRMYRWVLASGVVERKPQFAFVLYNIAVQHIALANVGAAIWAFHTLEQIHPMTIAEAREWARNSEAVNALIDRDPAVRRRLAAEVPAIFAA